MERLSYLKTLEKSDIIDAKISEITSAIFEIQSSLLKNIGKESSPNSSCSCDNGQIVCPGCNGEKFDSTVCAGCEGSGIRTCGKCGGNSNGVDRRKIIPYRKARELTFKMVNFALMRERVVRSQEIINDYSEDKVDVSKRFDDLEFGEIFDSYAKESNCF